MQEPELAVQRSAGGLRQLTTMKTHPAQYVAAGNSALLEQQLEQLHAQWEELCTKVSARRWEKPGVGRRGRNRVSEERGNICLSVAWW